MMLAAMSWLLLVAPGGLQAGFGVAVFVEQQAHFLELLAASGLWGG
jgi:hypothetical protein